MCGCSRLLSAVRTYTFSLCEVAGFYYEPDIRIGFVPLVQRPVRVCLGRKRYTGWLVVEDLDEFDNILMRSE